MKGQKEKKGGRRQATPMQTEIEGTSADVRQVWPRTGEASATCIGLKTVLWRWSGQVSRA